VIVYVTQKIKRENLAAEDLIPRDIDGIPVRVVEAGPFLAQDDSAF
jgi:hypothetical protein